jgi:hypothetical protein
MTIPTDDTLFPGEYVETIDLVPGEIYPEEMSFSFVEDYGTYSGGFWWKVLLLEDDCIIRVAVDTFHLFVGKVIKESVAFEEVSLQTSNYIRRGTFRCVSLLQSELSEVDVADYITEINLHKTTPVTVTSGYPQAVNTADLIAWPAMFASFVQEATGQTYDVNHVLFRTTNSDDLQFTFDVAGKDDKHLSALYFFAGDDRDGGAIIPKGFLDTGNDLYWPDNFGNCWQLLISICNSFAIVPRLIYDTSDSKYKMELITRGRTSQAAISFADAPISSTVYPSQTMLNDIRIRSVYEDDANHGPAWIRKQPSGGHIIGVTTPTDQAAAFDDIEWDLDLMSQFSGTDNTDGQYVQDWEKMWQAIDLTPWAGWCHENVEFWNYVTGAWAGDVSYPEFWLANLARYYYERFRGGKLILEREYPSCSASDGSTTKTTHVEILRKMALDMGDGEGSRNFFITEVRKNLATNRTFLRLHEI